MVNPGQPFYPPGGLPPPVDYPDGPVSAPGYPPPGYGYPGPYRPPRPPGTNGLATASLLTSVLGLLLSIPLTLLCWIGALIPIIGIVLGVTALTQIRQTGQAGRELAIGGIAVGVVMLAVLAVLFVALFALVPGSVP